MARSKSIDVKISIPEETDKLLGQIPINLRRRSLKKALRKAGQVVAREARRLAPRPGYPGDKPGKKPLKNTIRVKVSDFGEVQAAFVGPSYPEGAHGHLVEFGHEEVLWGKRTGGFVREKPFMRPAADSTEAQQREAIISTLKKDIEKLA